MENHRHFDTAQAGHLAFLQIADVLAHEIHTVGSALRGFWQQAHQRQRSQRFTAAGFADDAQRLAAHHVKGQATHRVQQARRDRDVDL